MKLWKHNERRQQRNRMSHGWLFYEGILSTDRQKEGKSCTYMWWKILGIRKSKTKDVGAVTSRDLCQKVWRSLWWEWALKWIVKMFQKYILIFHMDIIYMGGEGHGRVLVSGLRGHMYSCGQFTMVYGKSH